MTSVLGSGSRLFWRCSASRGVLVFSQRGEGAEAVAPLVGYAAALGSALAMAWYTLAVGGVGARRTDLLLVATAARRSARPSPGWPSSR